MTAPPRVITRLAQLMEARGLNNKQLCELAGVTPRVVTGLRRNSTVLMDANTLGRLCAALEVTPGELLTIEGDGK